MIFAAVNSIAAAFGQAATQAPQPMQAAASKARRRSWEPGWHWRRRTARGRADKSAGLNDAVKRGAVDDQIAQNGKTRAPGSSVNESPSLKKRMESWHTVVPRWPPCATPLIRKPQEPQMPSRQSCSKATGASPGLQVLVEQVQHFQERHVRRHVLHLVGDEFPGRLRVLLPPNFECEVHGYL